jgi:hypothetical protein
LKQKKPGQLCYYNTNYIFPKQQTKAINPICVEPRQANLNEGPKEKNRDNFSSTIQENPTIKYHMKKPCISVNYPWLKITSHKFKSTGAVKVTMEVKMTKILIRHHLCLVNCPWSKITAHKFMLTGAVKVTMKVKMTEILNRYHLCLIQVPNNSIYETSKMEIFFENVPVSYLLEH